MNPMVVTGQKMGLGRSIRIKKYPTLDSYNPTYMLEIHGSIRVCGIILAIVGVGV